jgi:hypothetical protein
MAVMAAIKQQSLFYGDIPDDDPIDYHDVDVGEGDPKEVAAAEQSLIQQAEKVGMSAEGISTPRKLVAEYEDVFRLKLGADPPADVKPLVIKLKKNVDPTRMSARKYSPPQLAFLRKKIAELERLGLVRKNGSAEWASPPLILPKSGPDVYRMTDLRVPNASTKTVAWPMPNMQAELQDLHGSEVYATLDFCQGYWQIPLHKDSQESHPSRSSHPMASTLLLGCCTAPATPRSTSSPSSS